MIWYENLYIGESIPKKNGKIKRLKWKIDHNAGLLNIYIIVLCRCGDNLLEIIPSKELLQKAYPKKGLFVVGIARGYDEALQTAAGIVIDVYQHTGGFQVEQYLLRNTKAGDGG